jgi:dTDP-4-amino-4,6-dideoxygalactose transaminase
VPGESPLFSDKLHVGCPNLGDRAQLRARFEALLDRRWLTNDGPNVKAFERKLATALGVKHCLAICNATIGLEIAIRALGLSGEVIVPSFTFAATAHALAWLGITPVFCDIDPSTHNIDPAAAEKLISPRTTGIVGVHVWGNPCDTDALADLAKRHGLRLLFDAAHAFGCSRRGQMIGNFGDAEVFSFHATKFLNSGEGGAIATNDDELAARIRSLRSFGMEGDQIGDLGTNGKMNEFSAAMGLTSLESMDDFLARNRANFAAYQEAFSRVPGIKLFASPTGERHNLQYIVAEVDESVAGISRDALLALLHAENVLVKRYFFPGCHRMAPYRNPERGGSRSLPHTERLCERVLQFPTGTAVSTSDVAKIGEFLRKSLARHRRAA